MHGEDKPHETEIMISMKVTDKDVIDAMKIYLQAHELHLCPFAAVNEEMPVLNFN